MNLGPIAKGLKDNKWQSLGETASLFLPSPVLFPCLTTGWDFYYFPKQTKNVLLLVVRGNSGNMNLSPGSSTIYFISTNKSLYISISIAAFPLSRVHFGSSKLCATGQRTRGQKAPIL